jgi:hypothetical protein
MIPTILSNNLFCPYCGRNLKLINGVEPVESSVDHVIGRQFVPKGYLENEWNLILDVCKDCNGKKGRLEDGLSSISRLSVLDDLNYPVDVVLDLQRKLGKRNKQTGAIRGATHPETNRPVSDSFVRQSLHTSFGPMSMSLSYIAPPQAFDSEKKLATLHIQGFYFLIANTDPAYPNKNGVTTPNSVYLQEKYIHPLFVLRRSDWGNEAVKKFVARTCDWETCFKKCTASGYFKVLMRRGKDRKKPPLFWVLEWNKNIRIFGMIREPGNPDIVEKELSELCNIEQSEELNIEREIPLMENEDNLFA